MPSQAIYAERLFRCKNWPGS